MSSRLTRQTNVQDRTSSLSRRRLGTTKRTLVLSLLGVCILLVLTHVCIPGLAPNRSLPAKLLCHPGEGDSRYISVSAVFYTVMEDCDRLT